MTPSGRHTDHSDPKDVVCCEPGCPGFQRLASVPLCRFLIFVTGYARQYCADILLLINSMHSQMLGDYTMAVYQKMQEKVCQCHQLYHGLECKFVKLLHFGNIPDALGMYCVLPVSMSPAQSLVSCLLAILQRFAHLQQYACLCVGCIQVHHLLAQLDLQLVSAHRGSALRLSVVCVVSTCWHMALDASLHNMRKRCRTEPMTMVPELLRV